MKQTLLLLLFFLGIQILSAQSNIGASCNACPVNTKTDFKIYPNPAADYIEFYNTEAKVNELVIFNMVVKPLKRFTAVEGKNWYDISDLANGIYLVQLLDKRGTVIVTRRISKK
jgi:hypothetical protein